MALVTGMLMKAGNAMWSGYITQHLKEQEQKEIRSHWKMDRTPENRLEKEDTQILPPGQGKKKQQQREL